MFFVQTERIKSNDTEEQNEVGEHVHDEGRDQAHLVLHRKCEILSCNMTMFGGLGDAVYLMDDTFVESSHTAEKRTKESEMVLWQLFSTLSLKEEICESN